MVEYTEKQMEQRRRAVARYTSEKVDRVNCLFPVERKREFPEPE